ncbi:DUF1997 domain-containing protein [Leptolyngbya sp. PCC 6406]|uniref:DUF1997 domain-containing protein n=1 Tax=Leptolyngbya sp. PCC 6406 TaxID=1173264 RepID=UPI0002ABCE85|nr:DUF1997 domain-containing protein [Leptolyngbya sp. PCC 6406]
MLHLHASQSVTLVVARQPVPIQHYLRQPRRLVSALISPSQVTELGNDVFRLHLRALQFFTLRIQPVVDLVIQVGDNGRLHLQSVGCEIRGNTFVDQRFDLKLVGYLHPYPQADQTHLTGRADLKITVDLPPILALTPRSLLETTGNQLLRGSLLTMKQRLMRQLATDYIRWSAEQSVEPTVPPTLGRISPQTPQ